MGPFPTKNKVPISRVRPHVPVTMDPWHTLNADHPNPNPYMLPLTEPRAFAINEWVDASSMRTGPMMSRGMPSRNNN
jgi:hypothetical protein